MNDSIDNEIAAIILEEDINFVCSVPCAMLTGVLKLLQNAAVLHIPVTREEEGVGIAAGASLGGKRPALLMQNSGLGNSLNALLSLTKLYRLPLPLVISHRGRKGNRCRHRFPWVKQHSTFLKLPGLTM